MTTAQLTADEKTKLNQLTTELKELYATLRKADSLTKKELRRITTKAFLLQWGFESSFKAVPKTRLRREVPSETQKLFFALERLSINLCASRFR